MVCQSAIVDTDQDTRFHYIAGDVGNSHGTPYSLGCGIICNQHVDAVNETSGAYLAGFCDVDEEKAEGLAKAFDVPHYADLDF